MKNKKIQIRISEKDVAELTELAKELDIPAAQILREGAREKIAQLKETVKTDEPAVVAVEG